MRLPDLVNAVRRKVSEGTNLAKNPVQMAWQRGRKSLQTRYERTSLGGESTNGQTPGPSDRPPVATQEIDLKHHESGPSTAGLAVATAAPIAPSDRSFSPAARYPQRLQPGEALQRGWWGRYTVGNCLRDGGWVRQYEGIQDNGSEPVWIYEYCLSQDTFDQSEIDERKRAFKQLVDLNLRLGDGADFRILKPKDVIVAPRRVCYLVTRTLTSGQLLADYLADEPGPLSSAQLRQFLEQVLQTLQYLQTYRVNWTDDSSEVGLPHGCLSPEHLWLQFSDAATATHQRSFFVHLSRFALWEHLFYPGGGDEPPVQTAATRVGELGSVEQDLYQLGQTCFALIKGTATPGDITDRQNWPEDPQVQAFYPYILRLLGQSPEGRFKGIDVAIAALRTLPETEPTDIADPVLAPDDSPTPAYGPWIALALAILGLGGLSWWLSRRGGGPILATCQIQNCRLQDIAPAVAGSATVSYGIEPDSYWYESFTRTLSSPLLPTRRNRLKFEQIFEQRDQGDLNLKKVQPEPRSRAALLARLSSGELEAGLIRTDGGIPDIPSTVTADTVAYDGIAAFVAYSDSQPQQSGAKRLQQVSFTQLQQLLTTENPKIDGRPVKLYLPKNESTLALLGELLFGADDTAQFVQRQFNSAQTYPPEEFYGQVLSDSATQSPDNAIGIGIDRISNVVGQCAVYPLALTHQGRTYPVLVNNRGKPVDIDTDLCGDKGSYWANSEIFDPARTSTYPLGYGMAVAYPTCSEQTAAPCSPGQTFAQKLLTPEGQYLLSETGLVPKTPIQEIRKLLWHQGGK